MATLRVVFVTALVCGMALSAGNRAARAAEGDVTFGSQWRTQNQPDARFQEFGERPRGGLLESFLLREWWGRQSLSVWGSNGLQNNQSTKATWTDGALYRVDLSYSQIPHTFSHVARWAWAQNAPGVFTLPDSLQARNQADPGGYTARMADLLSDAPGIGLGFTTNTSTARLRSRPARGWQFEARGSTRNRSGFKPYAMSFGFTTALENPEPLHQRMLDTDFIISHHQNRLSVQASGGYSRFTNEIGTLTVDNPRRLTDAAGSGGGTSVLDLYPDNETVRGSLTMTYSLPSGTAILGSFTVARGWQNDPFLPLTSNSALPQSSPDSLPAPSLDGKAVQMHGDVRVTTSPVEGLNGALRFRFSDYDNQTEVRNFIGQSPYDASWQRFTKQQNHIYDNRQWQAGLDLDWAFTWQFKVGAIAEHRVRERSEREVEKDKETVVGGRVRLRPIEGLAMSAKYTRGDRQADAFHVDHYVGLRTGATAGLYDTPGLIEQPGLRRFDVADRIQHRVTADASYTFGQMVDVGGTYSFLRNEFRSDTTLGLKDDLNHMVSSAGTIHVNERLDLTGGYGYGRGTTRQDSRTSPATMSFAADSNWSAKIRNEEVFVFGGFDYLASEKVSIAGEYQFSRNVTKFDLEKGTGNAQDLPTTFTRFHQALVDVRWRWLENTTIIGRWAWEGFDISDWGSVNVPLIFPTTGSASAIFLGDSSQSYVAHRLALLLKHTF